MRLCILGRLPQAKAAATVTNAGIPLIFDPDLELVRACLDEGSPVTMVPGASASLAALALFRSAQRPFSLRRIPTCQGDGAAALFRRPRGCGRESNFL